MDLEADLVGDAELFEPPRQSFASAVLIEERESDLVMEPLVGQERHVSVVLPADSPGGIPLHVGLPSGGSLKVFEELHHGKRAAGVPNGLLGRVSILI